MIQIIIDTHVFITALRSNKSASFKLFTLIGKDDFETNVSVPLIIDHEDVVQRDQHRKGLSNQDIDDILNFLCKISNHHEIFYLWRPILKDPKNDLVLEVAVKAKCQYIVTYNLKDFKGVEKFGIKAITPKEFLETIGAI